MDLIKLAVGISKLRSAVSAHQSEYARRERLFKKGQLDIMQLVGIQGPEISVARDEIFVGMGLLGPRPVIGNSDLIARAEAMLDRVH